jgi:hypothetical protein
MLPLTQIAVIARVAPLFANYDTLRGLLGVVIARGDVKVAAEAGAPPEAETETSVGKADTNAALLHALAGMVQAFSRMSDEDREFVIDKVMSLCTRQSGAGMAKIWNDSVKRPMFDDLDLPTILVIVKEVLTAELTPFFSSGVLTMFAGLLQ